MWNLRKTSLTVTAKKKNISAADARKRKISRKLYFQEVKSFYNRNSPFDILDEIIPV